MLQVLRVTNPANLTLIADVIHDRWFDVDEVVFDGACVRVPFKPDWVLEISDVESCQLEESEGVGIYDFNKLVYSEPDGSLTVTTGIPLVFRLTVSGLDVSLSEITGD